MTITNGLNRLLGFTRIRPLFFATCGFLFCGLFLAGCCCCFNLDGTCPASCSCCRVCVPVLPTQAPLWAKQIDAGEYDKVIQGTTKVIQAGKQASEYAQALLYRGVAEFNLGDLKSAQDDLANAQELSKGMSKDEQLRLFRTQMVVLARLGDIPAAELAFKEALTIAPPELQDAIRSEYEKALKP